MQEFLFGSTNIFKSLDILLAATGQELSVWEIRQYWQIGSGGGRDGDGRDLCKVQLF